MLVCAVYTERGECVCVLCVRGEVSVSVCCVYRER